jgi:hypothetical protein
MSRRRRHILPEWALDEQLCDLPAAVRLLHAFLPCYADRDGILEDRPRRIGFEVFPTDLGVDVGAMLDQLVAAGAVVRYEGFAVDGDGNPTGTPVRLLLLRTFAQDQRTHDREAASTFTKPNALRASCESDSNNLGAPKANLGTPEADQGAPSANLGAPEADQGALDLDLDLDLDLEGGREEGSVRGGTETRQPGADANFPRADANVGMPKANLGLSKARLEEEATELLSKLGVTLAWWRDAFHIRGDITPAHVAAIRGGGEVKRRAEAASAAGLATAGRQP